MLGNFCICASFFVILHAKISILKAHTKSIIILSTVFTVVATVIVGSQVLHLRETKQILNKTLGINTKLISNILKYKTETLTNVVLDYSAWDDMYDFMNNKDTLWAIGNIQVLPYTYDVDLVCVFDKDFKPYLQYTDSTKKILKYSIDSNDLKKIFNKQANVHYFDIISDKIIEIHAAGIVPYSDAQTRKQKPAGYILIGKYINNKYIKDLEHATNFNISISLTDTAHNINIRDSILYISKRFKTIKKDDDFTILFKQNNPAYEHYNKLKKYAFVFIFIAPLFMLFIYFNARRIIFRPLSYISEMLDSQNPNLASKFTNKKDEFGKIAQMLSLFFKQKDELKHINDRLDTQKQKLEKQNNQIKSSIEYALTIQKATFPNLEYIEHYDIIYINKPKAIVSGDFVWHSQVQKKGIDIDVFALIDCTGHGVPGAFLSLIGSNILNNIVNVDKITNPKIILANLEKKLLTTLRKNTETQNDGMDISVCQLHRKSDIETKLIFASAMQSILIFRYENKKVELIKGSDKEIGGLFKTKENIEFENNSQILYKNDIIIMFSDGITDMANVKRKKFGTNNLIRFIENLDSNSFTEVQFYIENKINEYQGNTVQRDDISLLGIKI